MWRGQGVPGVQVGRTVVAAKEGEDVGMAPDVDAVALLVAGGAEGGAWPRRFGGDRVVTQRPWRGGRGGRDEGETKMETT